MSSQVAGIMVGKGGRPIPMHHMVLGAPSKDEPGAQGAQRKKCPVCQWSQEATATSGV